MCVSLSMCLRVCRWNEMYFYEGKLVSFYKKRKNDERRRRRCLTMSNSWRCTFTPTPLDLVSSLNIEFQTNRQKACVASSRTFLKFYFFRIFYSEKWSVNLIVHSNHLTLWKYAWTAPTLITKSFLIWSYRVWTRTWL